MVGTVERYWKRGRYPQLRLIVTRSEYTLIQIDDFLENFSSALSRATALDNKVISDVSAVASKLSFSATARLTDLVILGLRQAIGSLEFTVSKNSNGTFAGMEDSRIFMKDVGNSRYVGRTFHSFSPFSISNPSPYSQTLATDAQTQLKSFTLLSPLFSTLMHHLQARCSNRY